MKTEYIVLEKPKKNKNIKEMVLTDQRVLKFLKKFVNEGEEQLKQGYSNNNLPKESPTHQKKELDGIEFLIQTSVSKNISYKDVYNNLIDFIKFNDFNYGKIDDNYLFQRNNEIFIEWNFLMDNYFFNLGNFTNLSVANKLPKNKMKIPEEIEKEKIKKLVIPLRKFNIEEPGSAKIWCLARKFYEELSEISKKEKKDIESKTKVSVHELPKETITYLEQSDDIVYGITSTPSQRKEYAKIVSRLFEIPQKQKPKGSKEIPIIITQKNYKDLLREYSLNMEKSLNQWEKLEGNIGELITFYYGIENNERVKEEFPFLPEYKKIDENNTAYVSMDALAQRIAALTQDYKKNRLAKKHFVEPIL